MDMTGDGASQPVEGVDALDDLADSLTLDPQAERAAPEEGEDSGDEQEVDDDAEQEEGDDEPAEPVKTKYTIKHDGKHIELDLTDAERDARLQQSFDYTNKTMAVAEERKAVQAERVQASERRQQYEQTLNESMTRLNTWTQYMESQVGQMPDTAMLDYDTAGYLRLKEQHEARRGQLQQGYAAQHELHQEKARSRQAWIQEKASATERELSSTLTGWSDNTLSELSDYAGKLGLNPQTANEAMLEPGFWQLAHKAQAYDAIQARKAQMKPTTTLARVSRPSASNSTGNVADRAKRESAFNKNPSVDALADLLR